MKDVLNNRMKFLPAILMCLAETEGNNALSDAVGEHDEVGSGNLPEQEEPIVSQPKHCINWDALGKDILGNIDWTKAEEREGKSGTFLTTTAHNVSVYADGFRYQIGMSVNRMPDKRGGDKDALTPQEKRAASALGLTNEEALKIKTLKAQKAGVQERIGSLKG